MRRSGITLLEVLFAITIIGIILAIAIPAVQSARETSRDVACKNNLRQLSAAMQSFARRVPPRQQTVPSIPVRFLPLFHCPSESVAQEREDGPTTTSYAGNMGTGVQRYGYNGMFRPLLSTNFYPGVR